MLGPRGLPKLFLSFFIYLFCKYTLESIYLFIYLVNIHLNLWENIFVEMLLALDCMFLEKDKNAYRCICLCEYTFYGKKL